MTARTSGRLPRRLGRPLLALVGGALVGLTACGNAPGDSGPGAPPADTGEIPAAEVSAAGADCTSDEILDGLLLGMPHEGGNPAPAAGTVPEGFAAVAVVLCTMELEVLTPAAPPVALPPVVEPGHPIPDPDAREQSEPAESVEPVEPVEPTEPAGPGPLTIVETTLTGDLAPLLEALARPPEPVPEDVACVAMLQSQPQIFLLDAAGAAVRPQWPVDACGFLHEGAAETLADLERAESTVHVLDSAG